MFLAFALYFPFNEITLIGKFFLAESVQTYVT